MDLHTALLGHDRKSNTNRTRACQNIALCRLWNVPPYISNLTLHNNIFIKTIEEETRIFYTRLLEVSLKSSESPNKRSFYHTLPGNPHRRKGIGVVIFCKTNNIKMSCITRIIIIHVKESYSWSTRSEVLPVLWGRVAVFLPNELL